MSSIDLIDLTGILNSSLLESGDINVNNKTKWRIERCESIFGCPNLLFISIVLDYSVSLSYSYIRVVIDKTDRNKYLIFASNDDYSFVCKNTLFDSQFFGLFRYNKDLYIGTVSFIRKFGKGCNYILEYLTIDKTPKLKMKNGNYHWFKCIDGSASEILLYLFSKNYDRNDPSDMDVSTIDRELF